MNGLKRRVLLSSILLALRYKSLLRRFREMKKRESKVRKLRPIVGGYGKRSKDRFEFRTKFSA
jgi:hypothetical protein